MKRCNLFFAGMVLVLFAVSCSKSNETDLGGNNSSCDTTNMSFVTNIKPILESNCYTCHSNSNFQLSGVKLEDYDDVKDHAEDGMLLGVITHAPGYPPMPQPTGKLSDCNINKIKAWIDSGAPNN